MMGNTMASIKLSSFARAVTVLAIALGVLLLVGASTSCRSDLCERDQQVPCTCVGGLNGVQVCSPDGRSLSDCQCFGSISDGGPEDRSVEDYNYSFLDHPADERGGAGDAGDGGDLAAGDGDAASDGPPDGDGASDAAGDAGPDGGDGGDGGFVDVPIADVGGSDGPADSGPGDGGGPPGGADLEVALSGALGTDQACSHPWYSLSAVAISNGFQITAQCDHGVAGTSGDLTQLNFQVAPDGTYTCSLASYDPGTCPSGTSCGAMCGGSPPRATTHITGQARVQNGRAHGSCTCIDDDVSGGFTAAFDLPL
jgi:hypothetical protein